MTTLNTHHIVQRGLRDDRFFRLGVGDGAWIEARGNLINLTTVEGTAASSMTPLHASNHGAILDGQRQLLEKFLTDRKYNGKTVEDLFNDQLTPNLDPVFKAQIQADARAYFTAVSEETGRSLLNTEIFLTHGDPRAPIGGLAERMAEFRDNVSSRFSDGVYNTPNAPDTIAYRNKRAAKGLWVALDTQQQIANFFNATPRRDFSESPNDTKFVGSLEQQAERKGVTIYNTPTAKGTIKQKYVPSNGAPPSTNAVSNATIYQQAMDAARSVGDSIKQTVGNANAQALPGLPEGVAERVAANIMVKGVHVGLGGTLLGDVVEMVNVGYDDYKYYLETGDLSRLEQTMLKYGVMAGVSLVITVATMAVVGATLGAAGVAAAAAVFGAAGIWDAATNGAELGRKLWKDWWERDDEKSPFPANKPGTGDPLVLDLAGAGIKLLGLEGSPAYFDYTGRGTRVETGWVGTGQGLLVRAPQDGTTVTNAELLGAISGNGFGDLIALDSNGDGVINASDAAYANLRIWIDTGGDGTSGAGELHTLASLGIAAINTASTISGANDQGNIIVATASFTKIDGQGQSTTHTIAEVHFAINSQIVQLPPPADPSLSEDAIKLPTLTGFGSLYDLNIAITNNTTLLAMAKDLVLNSATFNGAQFDVAFQAMVIEWAGGGGINPASRGGYVDARHLKVAYSYFGIDEAVETEYQIDPNWHNGPAVWEPAYRDIIDAMKTRFVSQIATSLTSLGFAVEVAMANPYAALSFLDYDPGTNELVGDVGSTIDFFARQAPSEAAAAAIYWDQVTPIVDKLQLDTGVDGGTTYRQLIAAALDADYNQDRVDQLGSILGYLIRWGTDGDDAVVGAAGNTILEGGVGNDIMSAGAGGDVLRGGIGNDNLQGGGGSDFYVFADGFGNDTVVDVSGGADTFAFQQGLTSDRVRFALANGSQTDVVVSFTGSADTILIQNCFDANGNTSIERFMFADGVELTSRFVRDEFIKPLSTSGDDIVTAYIAGSTILSGAGNDSLIGREGADILIGGTGNDQLNGYTGDDVYRFARGDGQDTVFDAGDRYWWGEVRSGGNDRIEFAAGIAPDDVEVVQLSSTDLALRIKGTTDQIRIGEMISQPGAAIETVRFANGTVWTSAEVIARSQTTTAGDDVIHSGYTPSTISSGAGNDAIYGSSNVDMLDGGSGNDTINAGDGSDVIIGGTGNDQLKGYTGDDVYRFARGDGQDTVFDAGDRYWWGEVRSGGIDRIEFAAGIAPEDVEVVQLSSTDLALHIKGTTDQIRINEMISQPGAAIEEVRFSNGATWTTAEVIARSQTVTTGDDVIHSGYTPSTLSGGAGNDALYGSSSIDTLDGGSGDDTINAGDSGDIIIGGIGNDQLNGYTGDDVYRFARGDGQDTVFDAGDRYWWGEVRSGGTDWIEFAAGITPDDVEVVQLSSTDLALRIRGTTDQIRISEMISQLGAAIEQVRFANGTAWTSAEVIARSQIGTAGDDVIYAGYLPSTFSSGAGNDSLFGGSGADTFDGGTGNDQLNGYTGDDVYRFARGDGQDIVFDAGDRYWWGEVRSGGTDRIELAAGIAPEDVEVVQLSSTDLALRIKGTTDQIRISEMISQPGAAIEEVRFANGAVWTTAEVIARSQTTTSGDDVIHSGYTPSTILGGAGNDALYGSSSVDMLDGGSGDDTINAGDSGDIIIGGIGNDQLNGYTGDDVYRFARGDGQDTVFDAGDRYWWGEVRSGGTDRIEFAAGIAPEDLEVVQLSSTDLALRIKGTTDQIRINEMISQPGAAIEEVRFANGTTWDAAEVLRRSQNRPNIIVGTDGNDTLTGVAGQSNHINGGDGNDIITGNSADDVLDGGTGDDRLYGRAGNDTLRGGEGNDQLRPGAGQDIVDGGDAVWKDFVLYDDATSGITLSLATGGTGGDAAGDTYTSIEAVGGSNFDDVISGSDGDDYVFGMAGADTLLGGGGADDLRGDSGADIIRGGDGNDSIYTDFNDGAGDQLFGDGGNDYIHGGTLDVVDGGAGDDQISIRGSYGAYLGGDGQDSISLYAANTVGNTIDGGSGYDRLDMFTNRAVSVSAISGIEWIWSSGPGRSQLTFGGTLLNLSGTSLLGKLDIRVGTNADTVVIGPFASYNGSVIEVGLYGADGNDTLVGSNQADVLSGGAGDDRLTGGVGNDNLSGGFGSDTAVFAGVQSDYSLVTDNGSMTIVDNAAAIDGNDGTDTLVGIEIAEFKGGVQIGIGAPVVLDLNGDGVKLIERSQSAATFTWDGSGTRQRTGWVDANDGILVFDRNGDGTVSGANEISFTGDKPGAKSDLDGLTAFDSDGDGQLGTGDMSWSAFSVWQDANGNGFAEIGEMRSVAAVGIASISVTKTAINRTWTLGDNLTVNTGSFTRTDGTVGVLGDVALAYDIGGTQHTQIVAKVAISDPASHSSFEWEAEMFGRPWARFQSPGVGRQTSFDRAEFDPGSSHAANLMVQAMSAFGAKGGIDDSSFRNGDLAGVMPLSVLDRTEHFATQRNGHCLA